MEFVACKECIYYMEGDCDLHTMRDGCIFGERPVALTEGPQHPNSNTEQSQLKD